MDPTQRGFQGGPQGGFPGGGRPGGRAFGLARLFFGIPPWALYTGLAVTTLILVVSFYQIYKKAGFNGLMGLLMLIPGVNLAAMLFLAFVEWPVTRQLADARTAAAVAAAVGAPASVAAPVEVTAV